MSFDVLPVDTEHDDPSFFYYSHTYGGSLSESAFNGQLKAAAAKVDAAIWPNQVTDATMEKYRTCVCAVVDALNDPAVVSEGAGSIRVQYAEPRTIASIIRDHLAGTGLLYRGI